ncbi:DUF3631 domain-containing protein [Streptomyces sp. DG2A-72]|uniref:DUF3631 domain-containing protein n=1 Tax=Streptomyces sp. DG2A-72 TaxID=3051386 RepID=UPI00265B8AB0|nr:DUF3631 domain-containing protein [Streptomyces sp. DG2A-72]MDO0936457.1 DUF3631 domain-containing protein [Streptomyces sp. DG2A-72]
MTQFPNLIDQVATAVLAPVPATENPHHRAILDVFTEVQDLDRQLVALSSDKLPDGVSAAEQLENLTDVLVERMAAGAELNALLSTSCCCAAAPEDDEDDAQDVQDEAEDEDDDFLSCPSRPKTIVHACLDVFSVVGDPDTMASADLVLCLRDLPGDAEGRWPYADLTQVRLAKLLAPYGVRTRNTTGHDSRRYKAYRRTDLLDARAGCSC